MSRWHIGDRVRLNPDRIAEWKEQGNFWWHDYHIEEDAVLTVVEVWGLTVASPGRGIRIQQLASDFVAADGYKPMSPLARKINKLYKKCPTTAHWEVNDV